MHARSALFDLYGDHLGDRGNSAPIASIVRLLGAVDVAAPAVRTAVSRMVREGWLERHEVQGQRGYAATHRAQVRLAEARARIYRTRDPHWDGQWHLVTVEHVADRGARARAAAALGYLGYARLAVDTWLAPRVSDELDEVLAAERLHMRGFLSRHTSSGADLAAALWDLESLGAAYGRFIALASATAQEAGNEVSSERAYAARTILVHEWRKFLFRDPGLPDEVLPQDWPGRDAAVLFDTTARSLLPLAREFVDSCLIPDAKTRS